MKAKVSSIKLGLSICFGAAVSAPVEITIPLAGSGSYALVPTTYASAPLVDTSSTGGLVSSPLAVATSELPTSPTSVAPGTQSPSEPTTTTGSLADAVNTTPAPTSSVPAYVYTFSTDIGLVTTTGIDLVGLATLGTQTFIPWPMANVTSIPTTATVGQSSGMTSYLAPTVSPAVDETAPASTPTTSGFSSQFPSSLVSSLLPVSPTTPRTTQTQAASQPLDIATLPVEPTFGTFVLDEHMIIKKGVSLSEADIDMPMLLDLTQACTWYQSNHLTCTKDDQDHHNVPDTETCSSQAGHVIVADSETADHTCVYNRGHVKMSGRMYTANVSFGGYQFPDAPVVIAESFQSSRIGGYKAFMQGDLAGGVLGLANQSYVGNELKSSPIHMVQQAGPARFFEIALPQPGGNGTFVLGGRVNQGNPATMTTGLNVYTKLIVDDQGMASIHIQSFCFEGTGCAQIGDSLGANDYVLDTLSLVIRAPQDVLDRASKSFQPPPRSANWLDGWSSSETVLEVDCDAKFTNDLRFTIESKEYEFQIPAREMVIQMPSGHCMSAVQPVLGGGKPCLGRPFWRNTIVGVDTSDSPGQVSVVQRMIPPP